MKRGTDTALDAPTRTASPPDAAPIAVFDLDGTLADPAHRLPLVDAARGRKDWPAFYAACVDDAPIAPIVAIARALRAAGHAPWIATGRSDEVRAQTLDWLARHNVPCERLVMRAAGDFTPDHLLKQRWLRDGTLPRARIAMAFEDRARVVRMWRAHGIACLQVSEDDD